MASENPNPKIDVFSPKLVSLRKQFEESLRLFNNKEVKGSVEKLRLTLAEMNQVAQEMGKDYLNALYATRLSKLKGDTERAEQLLSEGELGKKNRSEVTKLLIRTHTHLNLIQKEFARNYGLSIFLKPWSTVSYKKILVGAGVVAVVIGAGLIYRNQVLSKQGLTAQYYADKELKELYIQKTDQKLNFRWGKTSPLKHWKRANYSIRWTGFLKIPEPGNYDFTTVSDDGVRVWIADQMMIDNWTTHAPTEDHASVALSEGYYPIKIEYFNAGNKASFSLLWKFESDLRKRVIPAENLVPVKALLDPDEAVYESFTPTPETPS